MPEIKFKIRFLQFPVKNNSCHAIVETIGVAYLGLIKQKII